MQKILAAVLAVVLILVVLQGTSTVCAQDTFSENTNISVAKNKDELLDAIGNAVANMQESTTIIVDYEIKEHTITFPQILKHAQERDAFAGALLNGMRRSKTTVNQKQAMRFEFYYYIDKEECDKIRDFAANFAVDLSGKTDYEKVKITHDYLIENCVYNIDCDGPYNCIFNGKSNCNGYALAFSAIMQASNIQCRYITGTDHAWNAVKLDGLWYNIDVTWDDQNNGVSYDYFLCGKTNWKKHRTTEATAGFGYNEKMPILNWAGTLLYWGWPVIIIGILIIFYKIKKKRGN